MIDPFTAGVCSPGGVCGPAFGTAERSTAGSASRATGPGTRLDVVSDTICPWCYVGKRRLAPALSALRAEGLSFDVRWRPFQLNPNMPKAGVDRRAYRSAKFGSWAKSRALDAQVAEAGRSVGLAFRHDLMAKTPNTLASHVLIRWAWEVGGPTVQERIVEALFAAYFTQGRDVGDPAVLAELGAAAGLNRDRTVACLSDPASGEAVLREEALARGLGLDGVPSVVLDGKLLFSGAQSVPVIVQRLRGAAAAARAASDAEGNPDAGA